jgi:hypothetical protein
VKKKPVREKATDESPEQVKAREALDRMKKFVERKDKFVNAVKAGKDRSVSAGKKG